MARLQRGILTLLLGVVVLVAERQLRRMLVRSPRG
jgi:hypothetical protein